MKISFIRYYLQHTHANSKWFYLLNLDILYSTLLLLMISYLKISKVLILILQIISCAERNAVTSSFLHDILVALQH